MSITCIAHTVNEQTHLYLLFRLSKVKVLSIVSLFLLLICIYCIIIFQLQRCIKTKAIFWIGPYERKKVIAIYGLVGNGPSISKLEKLYNKEKMLYTRLPYDYLVYRWMATSE